MPVDLEVQRRSDGSVLLSSRIPLRSYEANLTAALLRRCRSMGDKPALAKRGSGGDGWELTTYRELGERIRSVMQWLLDHAPPGRAVMMLAGNTPGFAIMTFAAWGVGLPVCPVSTGYGALGGDYGRLRHVVSNIRPGVVFVEDAVPMAGALEALDWGDARLVSADFAEILKTAASSAVDAAVAARRPPDLAAYMLTSGSTGLPKIVPTTLDNLAANGAQCQQTIGEAAGWSDVMLDWLPWHHAAGAFVLRTTLLEGGTLYIDDGKPAPGLFDASIRNMREISVCYVNNVPAGYALLVEALERDPVLRSTFFGRLRLMLYGGAGLPQQMVDRLQAQAVAETGCRIVMISGYGATETVSAFMVVHFQTDEVGIGLPTPGVVVKLTPHDHRYEVRVKGPNVTGGYLNDPGASARAFDEKGYYRLGDLAVFHDSDHPERGLAYAGRLAEEFKLATGSWVYGGEVRDHLLGALSPLVHELVLCDDNRPYLGVLLWLSARSLADALGESPAPAAAIAERLARFNQEHRGSSSTVRRALILVEPPSANHHEISDKGTINRRAVLDRRAGEVERLYAAVPDQAIIVLS